MTPTPQPCATENLSITAVERETGIAKDTLRIWERRYGFPQPLRDGGDDRRYPPSQVQRLKRIRRLLDAGHRPGKVVHLDDASLQSLLDKYPELSKTKIDTAPASAAIEAFLHAIETHASAALREALQRSLMRHGMAAFVHNVVAPLTTAVGQAWAQGRFEVFEEHLYTEVISSLLRSNLEALRHSGVPQTPKVLLTTVPQELHSLGLLMVECLLTLESSTCISLGTQTPLGDIVLAAAAYEVDVVALSFTNVHSAATVHRDLRDLRNALPSHVEIWVGGACTSLYQKPLVGITALQDLHGLPALLAQWRARH